MEGGITLSNMRIASSAWGALPIPRIQTRLRRSARRLLKFVFTAKNSFAEKPIPIATLDFRFLLTAGKLGRKAYSIGRASESVQRKSPKLDTFEIGSVAGPVPRSPSSGGALATSTLAWSASRLWLSVIGSKFIKTDIDIKGARTVNDVGAFSECRHSNLPGGERGFQNLEITFARLTSGAIQTRVSCRSAPRETAVRVCRPFRAEDGNLGRALGADPMRPANGGIRRKRSARVRSTATPPRSRSTMSVRP